MIRFHALGGFAPDNRHADLSVYQYVINVFPLFIQYLVKLLFPVNLNAFYVFHPVSSILEMRGILSLTATTACAVGSFIAFKRSKKIFFSLLLIVVPLLPALYIPGLSVNIFAERYLYLPSVGFVMLSALFVAVIRGNHPKRAAGLVVSAVLVVGLYAMGTVNRNVIWKDDYTLWTDTAKKSPDGALVHVNFGQALQMRGLRDKAIEQYQIALRLDPNDSITHFNLGLAFFLKGWMDMAAEQFQIALLQDPDYPDASYYLQLALSSKPHQ
jgi:tetratricopeptide (TPR) repeat protein